VERWTAVHGCVFNLQQHGVPHSRRSPKHDHYGFGP